MVLDRHGALQALAELLEGNLNGLPAQDHVVEAVPVRHDHARAQVSVDQAGHAAAVAMGLEIRPDDPFYIVDCLAELGPDLRPAW